SLQSHQSCLPYNPFFPYTTICRSAATPSSVVLEGDAVESEGFDAGRASAVTVLPPARPRKLAKVPFVELADGRLQGVVSSGSDRSEEHTSELQSRETLVCRLLLEK